MKRTIALVFAFGFCAGLAWSFSLNFDPNQTGSIVVSNNPAAPTQIFTNDLAATRTYIINTSTNNLFLVGYSTTSVLSISSASIVSTSLTNGSFFIQGATSTITNGSSLTPIVFSPDGSLDPYRGPIWAVSGNTGSSSFTSIQRFRAH